MFPFRRRDPLPGEPGFKREAAKELIQSAKTYVREGKEIYKNAQDEAYSARNDADRVLGSYTTFCRDTLQKLDSKLRPVIAEFKSIDVDSRVTVSNPGSSIDFIDVFLSSVSDASLHAVKLPNISGIVDFPNPLSDFFDSILEEYQYEKAKEQCARARAYRDEMRMARQEFRAYRDKMRHLCSVLEQDKKQITELTSKISSISDQLQSAMKKDHYSRDEAEHLKSICQIADGICVHLSSNFLQNDGTISAKFEKQFAALTQLNQSIPAAPRIDDQTFLNILVAAGKLPIEK